VAPHRTGLVTHYLHLLYSVGWDSWAEVQKVVEQGTRFPESKLARRKFRAKKIIVENITEDFSAENSTVFVKQK
jgi:hypothetical protein